MPSARQWFKQFAEEKWAWSGAAFVGFWSAQMRVSLDKKISEEDLSAIGGPPSDRQFEILDEILNYRGDFVSTLECALFDYYEEHGYGVTSIFNDLGEDITDRVAPELQSPAEIWKLIRAPFLIIPYLEDDAHNVAFRVDMDCTWDDEHGICAVVRDWKIASDEVGQIGNLYDVFTRRASGDR